MLLIRRTQFALIGQRMESDAVELLAHQLRAEFPQQLASTEQARSQARLTMDKAVQARIDASDSILDLARLLMRFGDELADFPDPAMARDVLAHDTLPGELKIEFLQRRLEPRMVAVDEEA